MSAMGYPPELLSQDERIEFEMRPHWRALIAPMAVTLAVAFGLTFVVIQWSDWFGDNETVNTVGRWTFLAVGIFLLVLYAIRPFLYWITTQYVFTDRRIIIRSGLVARQGRDMPLSKVNNVSFDVSVMGRFLNYGRLTIDSASDEALVINDVPNVERIQREVNRLHEEDSSRRRGEASSE